MGHATLLRTLAAGVAIAVCLSLPLAAAQTTPEVGGKAPEFTLTDAQGQPVTLSKALAQGPIVLIVGRGWPGYQCPFCTRQFSEFRSRAADIAAAGARVLWVYPGPEGNLAQHAADFAKGSAVPDNFRILLDPAYKFTHAYGLRWDAPRETAYPATFVIDRSGIVRFAEVSREHGGRTRVGDVLAALAALPQ